MQTQDFEFAKSMTWHQSVDMFVFNWKCRLKCVPLKKVFRSIATIYVYYIKIRNIPSINVFLIKFQILLQNLKKCTAQMHISIRKNINRNNSFCKRFYNKISILSVLIIGIDM